MMRFAAVRGACLLPSVAVCLAYSALAAVPVEVSSGSGTLNVPNPLNGIHFYDNAGNRSVGGWPLRFNGFQWNGNDYSSGEVFGILNQTASSHSFNIFELNDSMVFDAGSGSIDFGSWGSNLKGNVLTLRGNGGSFSHSGNIQSSAAGGGIVVEEGLQSVSIGGPIATAGGNIDIFGGGTGSFNGAALQGGRFVIHGDRDTSYGTQQFNTGGGKLEILGGGEHTFNGTVQLEGGDLVWSGSGGGAFNNNLSSGGGSMSFSNTGDFSFGGPIHTDGGDFLWTVDGNAQFNNNLNASGGQIAFTGSGDLTFSNPVQTTTLDGDIFIGGSQNVTFTNTVSTTGGSITFGDGATVDAQNTINTGGGAVNVVGSANVSTGNTIQTGGGDIHVTSDGNFTASGNVNTDGGSIYVTGDGDTTLTGWVNTADGDIYLTGNGTTSLNNDPSLGSGEIIVIGGGTLILDADGSGSNTGSTRINVLLEGGTFRTAGNERYIDTLTLSTDSRIDMGSSGSSLMDINNFTAINNFNPWDMTSQIIVENFGVAGDEILFNANSGAYGNEEFFRFEGDYGQGYGIYYANLVDLGGGAYRLTPGDLDMVVIPEQGTVGLGALLVFVAGFHFWRRRKAQKATT